METEGYTVVFDITKNQHEIRDAKGDIVGTRVTPGGTIAELLDLGMSEQEATAKVVMANKLAWQEA